MTGEDINKSKMSRFLLAHGVYYLSHTTSSGILCSCLGTICSHKALKSVSWENKKTCHLHHLFFTYGMLYITGWTVVQALC